MTNNDRVLLSIWQDEEGDLNYWHETVNIGSILAMIGFMEKIKMEMIEDIDKQFEKDE